jgi:hypothetical protein
MLRSVVFLLISLAFVIMAAGLACAADSETAPEPAPMAGDAESHPFAVESGDREMQLKLFEEGGRESFLRKKGSSLDSLFESEFASPIAPRETNLPPFAPPSAIETPAHRTDVPIAPEDPCLPALYTNWQEFGQDDQTGFRSEFIGLRIFIDRLNFELVVDGIRKDDSVEEIYRTHVALGEMNSPTPGGRFVINHIYCYPDVVYFDAQGERVPGLYNGFFAPLLLCDEHGRCQRFRELGLHGFQASAIPIGRHISPATFGAVSAGCIRVPDPCKLKRVLIQAVGVGALKQNDRGCYHWLKKPIEVVIGDRYPGMDEPNLVSIFEQGLTQVGDGLKSLLDVFR